MNSIGKVSRWADFSWFILWHMERVGRTDYADGTDGLALMRDGGMHINSSLLMLCPIFRVHFGT